MNKDEIKAQLDAAWEKYYELEDKGNAIAGKFGKDSPEFASAVAEFVAARQHKDELGARYEALTRNGRK